MMMRFFRRYLKVERLHSIYAVCSLFVFYVMCRMDRIVLLWFGGRSSECDHVSSNESGSTGAQIQ